MLNDVLDAVLGFVRDIDPVLRTGIVYLALLLETSLFVGLIVPGDSVVVVAATAITSGVHYWSLTVAAIAGALSGSSLGFLIGRWFGPKLRASRLGRRLGEHNWVRAERYLARRGGFAVFVSRFLPVLHALTPVTVGMSGMRYRRFIAWSAPASAIWAFAYVSAGWAAAESYEALSDQLHFAGYLFAGILVAFALVVVLIKRLLHRAERRHLEHPDDEYPAVELPDDGR